LGILSLLLSSERSVIMVQLNKLKNHLKEGHVYRRDDLKQWSNAIDRHLGQMVKEGTLEKLSQGLYYYPEKTVFGRKPPEEKELVRGFLKDDRFLLTTPNSYNSLGVGTTQLYNKRVVYNHKRHGEFRLGNRTFDFQRKHHFPSKATPEFLLVDLVNNLDNLAEDHDEVLTKVMARAASMDVLKLNSSVEDYGSVRTKKVFQSVLTRATRKHA
jgi:hypothetical protein